MKNPFRRTFNYADVSSAARQQHPDNQDRQQAFIDGASFMYQKKNSAGVRVIRDEALRTYEGAQAMENIFEDGALYQQIYKP